MEVAEEVDLDFGALGGVGGGQVAVHDTLADRIAVVRAGDVAENAVAVQNWLLAHDDDRRIVDGETAQLAGRTLRPDPLERGPAEEVAFPQAHGEAEAGFVGVVFGVNVRPPEPIPFLEAKRLERAAP